MFWLLRQSPSTSEDESGSTSEESHAGYATARLSALSLESLHCLGGSPDQSSYAANGMNRKRMKTALKHPCACNCSVPLTVLERTCSTFWGLPKSGQDAVLWSLQANTGATKTQWMIEGLVGDFPILVNIWFFMFKRIMFNMPLSIGVPAIASPYRIWSVPGGMAPPGWGG